MPITSSSGSSAGSELSRLLGRLAVVIVALAIVGCDRKPSLPSLPSGATVLAFGDSLTFGTGATERESYPAVLERLTGRRVVRSGVPGEVSAAGLARLPAVLADTRPQLMILIHGGNDILRRGDERQTAANLRNTIKLAREQGIAVLMLSVPKPGLFLSAAPFYAEVAQSLDIAYDAETLPKILGDNALKSDPVHPNAQGYARLANGIAAKLRAAGAL